MPSKIIKKRVLKGVQSFEVGWIDHHGILCKFELKEELLITTEPQEIFRTAYPDLVEKYMKEEEEAKSRKGEQCYTWAIIIIIYSITFMFKIKP